MIRMNGRRDNISMSDSRLAMPGCRLPWWSMACAAWGLKSSTISPTGCANRMAFCSTVCAISLIVCALVCC